MKRVIPLAVLGFGAALAVIIGQRMSMDAMAVIIGVAVGIAASIPTSLLLIARLRRERQSGRQDAPMHQQSYQSMQAPGIMMIDPRYLSQNLSVQPQLPMPPAEISQLPEAGIHRLRVVGADDDWGPTD